MNQTPRTSRTSRFSPLAGFGVVALLAIAPTVSATSSTASSVQAGSVPSTSVANDAAQNANGKRYTLATPTVFPGATIPFPQMGTFVKGEPLRAFEPGVTYVFDFFNTKCNLCASAAPVIAEWEQRYRSKNFKFIAVTWENEAITRAWLQDPPHSEHAPTWVVADPSEAAAKVMQYPTFQNQSPRLFAVRDGVVLWFGHPDLAEEPLAKIADGTWNPASVRDEFIQRSQNAHAFDAIRAATLKAQKDGSWNDVFQLYDAVIAAIPARADSLRAQRFVLMLSEANMIPEGYAYGRELAVAAAKDASVLRNLARGVLEAPQVRVRDVDFAMALARAAESLGPDDPKSIEVIALAHFAKGDRAAALVAIDRAIQLQTEAKTRRAYEMTKARLLKDPPGPKPTTAATPAPAPPRKAPQ